MRPSLLAFSLVLLIVLIEGGCRRGNIPPAEPLEKIRTVSGGQGPEVVIEFKKGPEHNHPLMAVWVEDTAGRYIQTLYVARSVARGIFEHGDPSSGKWMPGAIKRPAALPFWAHKRGVQEDDGWYVPSPETAIPDVYSGPTPKHDFILTSRLEMPPPEKFRLLFEINQTWDWNEYWTNNKYPDDEEYKTSCQPALVYAASIDMGNLQETYDLKVIGHSHYSGKNGNLFTDLSTITTALEITKSIQARLIIQDEK